MIDKPPFSETYIGKLRAKIGTEILAIPCARVILENDAGQIVMIKRTDNGLWALPAGAADPRESIEDCAKREVREETGLKLKSCTCYGFSSNPDYEVHRYPNGDDVHAFASLFFSKDFEGEIGDFDDEVSEARFFALDDLPPAEQIPPHEYISIQRYIAYKKTGLFQWL